MVVGYWKARNRPAVGAFVNRQVEQVVIAQQNLAGVPRYFSLPMRA